MVLSGDGLILTNNHVVEAASGGGTILAVFQDGTTAPADVVGLSRQRRDILETAQTNGQARPDLDIEVIVAMFVGSFYAMTIAGRWEEGENWATRLTDTILAVIAPPEPPHE